MVAGVFGGATGCAGCNVTEDGGSLTGGTGGFAVNQLLGGRYRVRAWRAPTFAQLGSEVTFIADGERRSFKLQLAAPNDIDISASAASPAVIVGQSTTVSMPWCSFAARAVFSVGSIPSTGTPARLKYCKR